MTSRQYLADRWLAKGRWAYVWRIGALFAASLIVVWLIAAAFAYAGWDNTKWNWVLPDPHPITLTNFLTRVALSVVSGLLFGSIMYYLRSRASKAYPTL